MASVCRLLARLRRNDRGNVLAIVGAALVPLTIMIGSGIDLSRAYMAKAKMQSACDAASLAARRVMKDDQLTEAVRATGLEFFFFNYPQGLYGASRFNPAVSKPEAGVIRIAADARIPTVVMQMFGFSTLPVAVSCDASLNFVNTDIVLVLDVTGSMNDRVDGTRKIEALQDAVMALYDELAPIQAQLASQGLRLRYGVVPYSSTVNVGRLLYADDPANLRANVTVPSRVSNMTKPVYTANTPTTSADWEVYNGTRTETQCQSYVGANDVTSNPGAPSPKVVTRYQGTATSSGYVKSQNWNYNGQSGSCRRWKIVETTTYDTAYAHNGWTYRHSEYAIGDYLKPSGAMPIAPTAEGTVRTAGAYNAQALAGAVTGGGVGNAVWNGCIEERDTVTSIDGGSSLAIPAGAYDLDINLVPNSDATRWRAMVPDLIYQRNAGTGSANSTAGASSTTGWIKGNSYESGYWACPTEARRLQVWDRGALDGYVKGLQTVGGTYHDIGMIWGARFISTGGVFGDSCDVYNGMPCNRHVIFMTDGDQTAYCNVYGSYGLERNDMRVRGSGGCSSDDPNNSTVKNLVARHEQRFRMACNAAKNTNTSVWVIGFATGLNANLTGCASSPAQADTAANRTALIAKFRQIGNQIGALRLTQ